MNFPQKKKKKSTQLKKIPNKKKLERFFLLVVLLSNPAPNLDLFLPFAPLSREGRVPVGAAAGPLRGVNNNTRPGARAAGWPRRQRGDVMDAARAGARSAGRRQAGSGRLAAALGQQRARSAAGCALLAHTMAAGARRAARSAGRLRQGAALCSAGSLAVSLPGAMCARCVLLGCALGLRAFRRVRRNSGVHRFASRI